jgi:hypothetical protein
MKVLVLVSALVFGLSAFAGEIPAPSEVTTFNKPLIGGLPVRAVDAFDYAYADHDAPGEINTNKIALRSARLLCRFAGFMRVYTYTIRQLKEDVATVQVIDSGLTANPVGTESIELDGKIHYTTVFEKISCLRK